MIRRPPRATRTDTLLPYTTLFLSRAGGKDKPPLAAQKLKHLAPRHLNASSRHPAEPMRTMGIGELIAQPGSHCREYLRRERRGSMVIEINGTAQIGRAHV